MCNLRDLGIQLAEVLPDDLSIGNAIDCIADLFSGMVDIDADSSAGTDCQHYESGIGCNPLNLADICSIALRWLSRAPMAQLTQYERQQILRTLKYGPAVPRKALAEYLVRIYLGKKAV